MGNSCSNETAVNASAPTAYNAPMSSYEAPPLSSAIQLQNGLKFDTIVIGGGLAGVTAAVELAKSGQRVALFEVNNYIGGRLKTTSVNLQTGGNVQFDQGASWIHGSNNQHPITKLSKNVRGVVMKQTDDDSAQVYDQQGNDVSDQVAQGFTTYQQLLQKCQEKQANQSMQQAFQQQNGQAVKDKFVMFNVSNDVEFQTSGGISKLAASGLDDDQFEGAQMLILSGYQRFAQTLASQAPFQCYLNQKIKKVVWKQGQSDVICANGITVCAKNVVLAVPIGVLKSKGIQFSPNLPNWKTQAINSIGFGNVCKILLDFSDGEVITSQKHYIGVVSEDISKRGLGTYFLNLKAIAGVPALMTFGLGDNADEAEKMPEAQLKAFLAKRITAFTQQQVDPNSFKLYKTSWRGNENFKGTYAYAATTTRPQHWQNMAKPVFESNWYFCGQHTTSKYRGTVHGAYLSGSYAAQWIKEKTTEEDWTHPDFQENGEEDEGKKSNQSK